MEYNKRQRVIDKIMEMYNTYYETFDEHVPLWLNFENYQTICDRIYQALLENKKIEDKEIR